MIGAAAVGAVALLTEHWSTAKDGGDARIGLYKLCWPDAAGGPVVCRGLDWHPFVAALLAAKPTLSWDEAASKWDVLNTARYSTIGATAGSFGVAALTVLGFLAGSSLTSKRILYGLASALGVACVSAFATGAICFNHLNTYWSNYAFADMQLGYSWTMACVGGGLAIVSSLLLVAHSMCLCFCPGACCSRASDDDDDELELAASRRGGAFRRDDEAYDDEAWWRTRGVGGRKGAAGAVHVTGSGTAGSAASSASLTSRTTTGESRQAARAAFADV